MKAKTIDEHCKKPAGSFKKFIEQKEKFIQITVPIAELIDLSIPKLAEAVPSNAPVKVEVQLSEVSFTKSTITLKRKYNNTYRWQRNDGKWVSPIFTSIEAANYMAGKIPFLTDDEWKEHYPLPKGE